MPRSVRKLRSLLDRKECAATRTASPKDAVLRGDVTSNHTAEAGYLFRGEAKNAVMASSTRKHGFSLARNPTVGWGESPRHSESRNGGWEESLVWEGLFPTEG